MTAPGTQYVTSKDGTKIAYTTVGTGPPLILVDGAFCRRSFGPMPKLAPLLADAFTVTYYDRRGRDESGDTAPFAVEREVEDLAALAARAGGAPFFFGTSSGAALALRAAAAGVPMKKLAIYEVPWVLEDGPAPTPVDYRAQIDRMLKEGNRSGVVKMFMQIVGVPRFAIAMMRVMPGVWPKLTAVAHTLPYDFAQLGDVPGQPLPADVVAVLRTIRVPTFVLVGQKSAPRMHYAAATVTKHVAGAELDTIPKQEHNIAPKALVPYLRSFFVDRARRAA